MKNSHAFLEGFFASSVGLMRSDNPYLNWTDEWRDWDNGWDYACELSVT
jgi:hypothetical protein